MGMEDQRQRGKGWKRLPKQGESPGGGCRSRAALDRRDPARGSCLTTLGSDLEIARPQQSEPPGQAGVRGEQRALCLLRDLQMCFHWPYSHFVHWA